MKTIQKVISVFLCMLMLLSSIPVSVFAEQEPADTEYYGEDIGDGFEETDFSDDEDASMWSGSPEEEDESEDFDSDGNEEGAVDYDPAWDEDGTVDYDPAGYEEGSEGEDDYWDEDEFEDDDFFWDDDKYEEDDYWDEEDYYEDYEWDEDESEDYDVVSASYDSVFAADNSDTDSKREEAIRARIDELYNIIIDNGGYFNATQTKKCGSTLSKHGCDNCKLSSIFNSEWFLNAFGLKKGQFKKDKTFIRSPWNFSQKSCLAFAIFANWYIFRYDNSDSIVWDKKKDHKCVNFTYDNVSQYASVGDYLRLERKNGTAHWAIFISCDKDGITVLDNNYEGDYACMVNKHTIGYGKFKKVSIEKAHSKAKGDDQFTPSAVTEYLKQCESEVCSFDLTVTRAANLWNMPCSNETNPLSEKITKEPVPVGTTFSTVTRLWKNTSSPTHIWYEVKTDSGITAYIYSEYVATSVPRSTLNVNAGEGIPTGTLKQGTTFTLTGTIKSNYKITNVEAHVYNASGQDALEAYNKSWDNTSFDIGILDKHFSNKKEDSILNSFDQLAYGPNYRYVVIATDASGNTKELINSEFDVGTNKKENLRLPGKPTVSVPAGQYGSGATIKISWTESAGNEDYKIDIYRDSTLIVSGKSMGKSLSYELKNAEAGFYKVTVTANNKAGNAVSEKCTFNVSGSGGGSNVQYTLTYEANGGSNPPKTQTTNAGTAFLISCEEPERDGFTFIGWATSHDATEADFSGGDEYTTAGNATLYAVWEYTIHYDAGAGFGEPADQIVRGDRTVSVGSRKPTHYGYKFLGWTTDPYGVTAEYQPGDTLPLGDNTLYAVWKQRATYTLSYDASGGKGAPSAQKQMEEMLFTVSEKVPNRYGFNFTGWYTEDGSRRYEAGEDIIATGNITLYAHWEMSETSGPCGQNVSWELTEAGELRITGTGPMKNYGSGNPAPWYKYREYVLHATIENGVTAIGNEAFYYCSRMTGVELPDTVTSIGEKAFSWCPALQEIALPPQLRTIGANAFLSCTALTEVSIPDSVESIGMYVFGFCTGLSSVTLPTGITSISLGMFQGCKNLTVFEIPETVSYIGDHAFRESGLVTITIPDGVRIGQMAFKDCWNLEHIYFDGRVSGYVDFSGCSSLEEIVLPEGVGGINGAMFEGCYSLTSIVLPASLSDILGGFEDLESLETITLTGDTPPSISRDALTNLTVTIYYPEDNPNYTESVMQNYGGQITWTTRDREPVFYDANGGEDAPATQFKYAGEDLTLSTAVPVRYGYLFTGWAAGSYNEEVSYLPGALYTLDGGTTLYAVWEQVDFDLPALLRTVEEEAFCGGAFTCVYVSDGVSVIGRRAFADCSRLEHIRLPSAISEIDPYAFENCGALTIHGKAGSDAEIFADTYGYSFMPEDPIQEHVFSVFYSAAGGRFADGSIWRSEEATGGSYYVLNGEEPTLEGFEFEGWTWFGEPVTGVKITGDTIIEASWRRTAPFAPTSVTISTESLSTDFNSMTMWLAMSSEIDGILESEYEELDYAWEESTDLINWETIYEDFGDDWQDPEYCLHTSTMGGPGIFYYRETVNGVSSNILSVKDTNYENQYCAVFYDANGGHFPGGSTVMADTWYGGSFSFPTPGETGDPTREGYTLIGWSSSPDGDVEDEIYSYHDLTIYAVWERDIAAYTVTYDAAGGSFEDGLGQRTETSTAATYRISDLRPSQAGYAFNGWELNGEKVSGTLRPSGDFTLVAQWERLYTVTYDAAGGYFVDPETHARLSVYEASVRSPFYVGASPRKEGSVLRGWRMPDGTLLHDSDLITITENITLTAVWSTICTITLDAGAGIFGDNNRTRSYEVEVGSIFVIPDEQPTRSGYSFVGWGTAYVTANYDMTIDAIWEKVYTDVPAFVMITADNTDIQLEDPYSPNMPYPYDIDVNFSCTVTDAANPAALTYRWEHSYDYSDWFMESEGVGENTFLQTFSSTDLTAVHYYRVRVNGVCSNVITVTLHLYGEEMYTVTYDANGGFFPDGTTFKRDHYGTSQGNYFGDYTYHVTNTDIYREGYTFQGWTLDGVTVESIDFVSEDITLLASWAQMA